jgi:hypothetical protein
MRRAVLTILFTVAVAALLANPAPAAQKKLAHTERFPAEAGKQVIIDVASLNVSLRSADVTHVEVNTDLRISGVGEDKATDWIKRHTPAYRDTGNQLTVSAQPGRQGFLGLGLLTARARIRVVAPNQSVPDITTTSGNVRVRGDFPLAAPLRLRTATGEMEFTGAAGSLDIRSAQGGARIDVVRPLDKLFARTSSGDVALSGGARRVQVDTASGDVRLDNLSGSAEVETSTGKVILSWDRLDPGSVVKVRTASGRVQLVLPDNVSPQGTLTTTGGTIRCDLPGTVNERGDTVQLDGDGPVLQVETASGEIVVGLGDEWDVPEVQAPGEDS